MMGNFPIKLENFENNDKFSLHSCPSPYRTCTSAPHKRYIPVPLRNPIDNATAFFVGFLAIGQVLLVEAKYGCGSTAGKVDFLISKNWRYFRASKRNLSKGVKARIVIIALLILMRSRFLGLTNGQPRRMSSRKTFCRWPGLTLVYCSKNGLFGEPVCQLFCRMVNGFWIRGNWKWWNARTPRTNFDPKQ